MKEKRRTELDVRCGWPLGADRSSVRVLSGVSRGAPCPTCPGPLRTVSLSVSHGRFSWPLVLFSSTRAFSVCACLAVTSIAPSSSLEPPSSMVRQGRIMLRKLGRSGRTQTVKVVDGISCPRSTRQGCTELIRNPSCAAWASILPCVCKLVRANRHPAFPGLDQRRLQVRKCSQVLLLYRVHRYSHYTLVSASAHAALHFDSSHG